MRNIARGVCYAMTSVNMAVRSINLLVYCTRIYNKYLTNNGKLWIKYEFWYAIDMEWEIDIIVQSLCEFEQLAYLYLH